MSREHRLAETFVALADTLAAGYNVIDFLSRLVRRCVELLGVSSAGVLLANQDGSLQVGASSSEAVRLLGLYELQIGAGPCLECFRSGRPVLEADLECGRWPELSSEAVALGLRSVQSVPLALRGEVIGTLNLFLVRAGGLHSPDVPLAQAMADIATIGILHERAFRKAAELAGQLQGALDSRIVIEQAKGMLAERCGIEMEVAFEALRGWARSQQRRLADVAAEVVASEIDIREMVPVDAGGGENNRPAPRSG